MAEFVVELGAVVVVVAAAVGVEDPDDEDVEEEQIKKLPSGKKTSRVLPVETPALQVTPAAGSKDGLRSPY